jgi:hexosaminidase
MSTSPYYDLGGDESPLSDAQYAQFVNKESTIVTAAGKTPMGWGDGYALTPGTPPPAGSVAESSENAAEVQAAEQKSMKLVMAPASHAYIDQTYPNDNSGLGLSWACPGCDLDQNYNCDPSTFGGATPAM